MNVKYSPYQKSTPKTDSKVRYHMCWKNRDNETQSTLETCSSVVSEPLPVSSPLRKRRFYYRYHSNRSCFISKCIRFNLQDGKSVTKQRIAGYRGQFVLKYDENVADCIDLWDQTY